MVEILAALAITAAFVGVIAPFIGQLMWHWWSAPERSQRADQWLLGIERISDDLGEALPLTAPQDDKVLFSVAADCIRFVRPALESERRPRLETVSLELRREGSGMLMRRLSAALAAGGWEDQPEALQTAIILRSPWQMQFEAIAGSAPGSGIPLGITLVMLATAGAGPAPPAISFRLTARSPVGSKPDAAAPVPPVVAALASCD